LRHRSQRRPCWRFLPWSNNRWDEGEMVPEGIPISRVLTAYMKQGAEFSINVEDLLYDSDGMDVGTSVVSSSSLYDRRSV
jgi:hypothetical protein